MPRKHASGSIALGLALLVGSAAQAAPRVVVITAEAAPADLEIARAELDNVRLDGKVIAVGELPLAGDIERLQTARREVLDLLEQARASFVRTDYTKCSTTAGAGDLAGMLWAGDPDVARGLAQLALVAAQCGEHHAYERAASRYPRIELDPARWSPDVRTEYERAITARENGPHGSLFVGSDPPGAAVFVDGERAGHTPLRMRTPIGDHAVLLLHDGMVPTHRVVEVQADKLTTFAAPLRPLADNERLGALRLAVESGEDPGAQALADAAHRLDADAVAVIRAAPGGATRGVAGGPGVGWAAFEQRGDRLAALRRVVGDVGRHVRGECGLAHTPPDRARAGAPLELSAQTGACLTRVRGGHRLSGARAWTDDTAALAGGTARLSLALPSSDHATVLEYFLAGETARGSVGGQAGSQTAPLRVPVDADITPAPWYRKWWVWTLAGVAVAGAGVAIYIATAPGTDARLGGP